jgi:hypothetical protein
MGGYSIFSLRRQILAFFMTDSDCGREAASDAGDAGTRPDFDLAVRFTDQ